MHGALYFVWGTLEYMGPFRMYRTLQIIIGPSSVYGAFGVHGALYFVWNTLECMGPFGVYVAL